MEGAERLIQQAIDTFGGLDVVINNAGILRDRMLTNMTEAEWDAVIDVHLKGTFGPSRHAAAYWRERSKAGEANDGRIINTTSPSGIYGNVGQTNYGAAKAGIAAFTIIAAKELGRYGVTVNAIAPAALTRMTENLGMGQADEETKEKMSPRWIAPIVTWLASPESQGRHRAGVRRHRPGPLGVRGLAPRAHRAEPHRRSRRRSARSSSTSWPRPAPTPTCSATTSLEPGRGPIPALLRLVGACIAPTVAVFVSRAGPTLRRFVEPEVPHAHQP